MTDQKKLVDPFEEEVWAKIPSMPPNFEASSLGNIRKYINLTDTELVKGFMSNGYRMLTYNKKSLGFHKLVAEAFVPNPEGSDMVKHKDGDKLNNKIDNLEWLTRKELMLKAKKVDIRNKIYCKERNEAYGTMRSAAFLTKLPQDIISRAIKNKSTIAGLTFQLVKYDDPKLAKIDILYVDFDTMYELATKANSVEELFQLSRNQISEDKN